MQTTSVNTAAIVAGIHQRRAQMKPKGHIQVAGSYTQTAVVQKKPVDPVIAKAVLRADLKASVSKGKMTVDTALAQAMVGEIADLPAFRLELLRTLPMFRKLSDIEFKNRLLVIDANRVNIAA